MKKFITIITLIALCLACCGCNSNETTNNTNFTTSETTQDSSVNTTKEESVTENLNTKPETDSDDTDTYGEVTIEMESGDIITIGLYPQYAPKTVENFVKLVNEGFYDGLIFHRVIENFMIQGGDPTGTGMGGSDKNIVGEFKANGFAQNTISHTRGVISMARSQSFDSASSQFFIVHADSTYLDGQYAAFGKVLSGMETVDKIASVQTNANDKPLTDVVMKKVTITKELNYNN